jgi:Putative peptidoglycan binding domain
MTLAARAHHFDQRSAVPPRRIRPLVWLSRRLKARPGSTIAHAAFVVAAGLILFNAVALQRDASRRSFIAEPASQPSVPMPPQRPAELQAQRPAAAAPPALQVPAPASVQRPSQAATTPRDPIGELIRSGQVAPGDAQRVALAPPERTAIDQRPVLAVQRALNRTGHGPVREDGLFGEGTRAAIERFERERRLPVTREMSPRTLRELASASGLRIE